MGWQLNLSINCERKVYWILRNCKARLRQAPNTKWAQKSPLQYSSPSPRSSSPRPKSHNQTQSSKSESKSKWDRGLRWNHNAIENQELASIHIFIISIIVSIECKSSMYLLLKHHLLFSIYRSPFTIWSGNTCLLSHLTYVYYESLL